MIEAFGEGTRERGHHTDIVRLYDMDIKGCSACGMCKTGKVEYCVLSDGMADIYPKLAKADVLVVASPVYFGQVTGPMKLFIDRLYCFMSYDYSVKTLPGKRFISFTVCGAPAENFQSVTDYLKKWFCDFLKLEVEDTLAAGGLGSPGDIMKQRHILEQARDIGKNL
jgi:multimeric flavodoxin WrbA